ncbi:MAG TPA: four helix bundle protein [Thermodesulfobacteriota bacterium]|nr:four helix bundle protein [Thermodesulfobacteriota bacterium]
MASIKNFRDLIVWQKAVELFTLAVKDVERFPQKKASRIIEDQLLRAVGSISANIAEGFGRKGAKELSYHLGVSKGSSAESEDWYEKIKNIGYLDENTIKDRLGRLDEIRKMLNSFISKI